MEKIRILLIDDEPSFTRMLKLNLERTGAFKVHCEANFQRIPPPGSTGYLRKPSIPTPKTNWRFEL